MVVTLREIFMTGAQTIPFFASIIAHDLHRVARTPVTDMQHLETSRERFLFVSVAGRYLLFSFLLKLK